MNKDERLFEKFKTKFSFIFNDQYLSPLIKDHFNKSGSFVAFVISLLVNRIDEDRIKTHLKINQDEWSELFCGLYKNQTIISLHKQLEINPIIPLEQIKQSFDCFQPFINALIDFLKKHELNLNIHESHIKSLITSVFGYILYNNLDNKIAYHFKDVLVDPEYDTKLIFIANNTKLFSTAKNEILSNCGQKINDLIELLLGASKSLSVDK